MAQATRERTRSSAPLGAGIFLLILSLVGAGLALKHRGDLPRPNDSPPTTPPPTTAPPFPCDVFVTPPRLTGSQAVMISAYAVADCTQFVDVHIMHIAIERETGAGWKPVVGVFDTEYMECTEPPRVGEPARCDQEVPCEPGHYRATASVIYEDLVGQHAYAAVDNPDAWFESCGP